MTDGTSFTWSFQLDGAPYKLQPGDWFIIANDLEGHTLQFVKGRRPIEVVTEDAVMVAFRLGIPADWAIIPSLVALMTGMRAVELDDVDGTFRRHNSRAFVLETYSASTSDEESSVTSSDPLGEELERHLTNLHQ